MDMSTSIAGMATEMKASQTLQKVQTSVMKMSLDTMEQAGNGAVELLNSIPKFSGENGFLFDARA